MFCLQPVQLLTFASLPGRWLVCHVPSGASNFVVGDSKHRNRPEDCVQPDVRCGTVYMWWFDCGIIPSSVAQGSGRRRHQGGDMSASLAAENETQKRSSDPVAIDGNNRKGVVVAQKEKGSGETDHVRDKDSLRVQGTTIVGGLFE